MWLNLNHSREIKDGHKLYDIKIILMLLSHDGTFQRWIHYNLSLNSTSFWFSITSSLVWLFRVDGCLVVQYDCGIIWKCRYFVWVSSVRHCYHLINLTLWDSSWGVYIVDLHPSACLIIPFYSHGLLWPFRDLWAPKSEKLSPKAKILISKPAVWCEKVP